MAASSSDMSLVRIKRGGAKFEIAVYPGKVMLFREKKISNLDEVVQQQAIYTNIANGVQAGAAELAGSFPEAKSTQEIIQLILLKGEVQLTAAERKEKLEKRRREVVNHLHKYYVNPKTNLPHPTVRIEAALDEMKVRIDPDLPADKQVAQIIKNMPAVLPIKKQEVRASLTIPHRHVGATHSLVGQYVKIETEQWTDIGCVMSITSNPGDWNTLLSLLNEATKGDFNLELEDGAATTEEAEEAGRGGRGGKRGGRGGRGAPKRK